MKNILIILVVLALTKISSSANTQCGLWNKGKEWRCAKDNAKADKITIKTTCNFACTVQFKIGKWTSKCHKKGKNYSTDTYAVGAGPGDNKSFDFEAAGDGNLFFGF